MGKLLRLTHRASTAVAAQRNPSIDLSQHPAVTRRYDILMGLHPHQEQFSEEADAGEMSDEEEESVVQGLVNTSLSQDAFRELAGYMAQQLLPAALVLAAGRLANKVSS